MDNITEYECENLNCLCREKKGRTFFTNFSMMGKKWPFFPAFPGCVRTLSCESAHTKHTHAHILWPAAGTWCALQEPWWLLWTHPTASRQQTAEDTCRTPTGHTVERNGEFEILNLQFTKQSRKLMVLPSFWAKWKFKYCWGKTLTFLLLLYYLS